MPGSRRIGLVIPVLLSMMDALVILSIIAEGRRCDSECASTLLVLAFTPLVGPLAIAGIGEPVHPSLASVALAYLITVALVLAWWWFITNRLAHWAGGSILRFAGGYLLALVVTGLLRVAFFPVQDAAGTSAAVIVEVAVAGLVLWRASRIVRPRPG